MLGTILVGKQQHGGPNSLWQRQQCLHPVPVHGQSCVDQYHCLLHNAHKGGHTHTCTHSLLERAAGKHAYLMIPPMMNMQISAVWAVGLAEGASHVNWRKIFTILCWWVGSLVPVSLAAAALVAQGMLSCPSARASLQGIILVDLVKSARMIERLLDGDQSKHRLVTIYCQVGDMHLLHEVCHALTDVVAVTQNHALGMNCFLIT